jgi:hypothetical protein
MGVASMEQHVGITIPSTITNGELTMQGGIGDQAKNYRTPKRCNMLTMWVLTLVLLKAKVFTPTALPHL